MHHALIAIAGNLVLRGERTKRKREGKEEEKDEQLADEAQRLCVGNLTELASLLTGTASLLLRIYFRIQTQPSPFCLTIYTYIIELSYIVRNGTHGVVRILSFTLANFRGGKGYIHVEQ